MNESPGSQIEFDMLGIGTVLKRNRLVVPPNQREYSWKRGMSKNSFKI